MDTIGYSETKDLYRSFRLSPEILFEPSLFWQGKLINVNINKNSFVIVSLDNLNNSIRNSYE